MSKVYYRDISMELICDSGGKKGCRSHSFTLQQCHVIVLYRQATLLKDALAVV